MQRDVYKRQVFVVAVLLVLIGFIFIRMDCIVEILPWHLWDIDCIAQKLKDLKLLMELC